MGAGSVHSIPLMKNSQRMQQIEHLVIRMLPSHVILRSVSFLTFEILQPCTQGYQQLMVISINHILHTKVKYVNI